MSSRNIEYYSLNGRLIGEFGLRASIAGELGVPTIYLTGDDKACLEAKKLIPEIVITETKRGKGWESAISRDIKEVHEAMGHDVQEALTRAETGKIDPLEINNPVVLEIYVRNWFNLAGYLAKGARGKGTRTAIFEAQSMEELVEKKVL
jgi:D-amino peptidase